MQLGLSQCGLWPSREVPEMNHIPSYEVTLVGEKNIPLPVRGFSNLEEAL
jgi:hypothetical protein